jgi:membrane-bound metal-dependent hydrolase YbcI (DUF457 family)
MMGPTHALSGLAAGAATLPFAPVTGLTGQLAWTACWGGMALLPDLDQRGTTSARMWGPISALAATVIGGVARGHRQGTHDALLAPLAFAAIASAACTTRIGAMVMLAIAIGLALHAVHFVIPGNTERTWPGNLLISAAAGYYLIDSGAGVEPIKWLPIAVVGGVLAHIAGDALTTEKVPVPLVWLVSRKARIGLPLCDTNSWLEPVVSAACGAAAIWQLAVHTGAWATAGLPPI